MTTGLVAGAVFQDLFGIICISLLLKIIQQFKERNRKYTVIMALIGDGVESLPARAFHEFHNLKTVSLNMLRFIPEDTFDGCENIKTISLPESVLSIVRNCFNDCSKLTEITISNRNCEIYDSENIIPASAVIYGYDNSTAHHYAEKYGRAFVNLGCEHERTEEIPEKAATCLEKVNTAGVRCLDCSRIVSGFESIEMLTHVDFDSDGLCDNCLLPVSAVDCGHCGDNLVWYLDSAGRIKVHGRGIHRRNTSSFC